MRTCFLLFARILLSILSFNCNAQPFVQLKDIEWPVYAYETPQVAGRLLNVTLRYYNPPDSPVYYLQLVMPLQFSTATYWAGQNLPLIPFQDTTQYTITVPVDSLNYHDSVPYASQICGFAYASQWYASKPTLPYQTGTYPVNTAPVRIGNQLDSVLSGLDLSKINYSPAKPVNWSGNDTLQIHFRGCTVPEIDLNDSIHNSLETPDPTWKGDQNACGPAATSSSFAWLMTQHAVIQQKLQAAGFTGDTALRKLMSEFSRLMGRGEQGVVTIDSFINGKLEFIDKYKLPVHVKYQSLVDTIKNRPFIPSPDPLHGHKAINKNLPESSDTNLLNKRLTWEFIKGEMAHGEDVEAFLLWVKPNGDVFGHYVTLTGFIQQPGGAKRIMFKDDKDQERSGGLRHQLVGIEQDSAARGAFVIKDLCDTAKGICYLRDVVSESYDTSVQFYVGLPRETESLAWHINLTGNPVNDRSALTVTGNMPEYIIMDIQSADGRQAGRFILHGNRSGQESFEVYSYFAKLPAGVYLLHFSHPSVKGTVTLKAVWSR